MEQRGARESSRKKIIVAIDGPSGAGKSTLARRIAKDLRYTYLDTGAMYRAFALKVLQEQMRFEDLEILKQALEKTTIDLSERDGRLAVYLDGKEVTEEIRAPEVSQMASRISTLRLVRERMVELQRALGVHGGVVAEGRDIGTVVFPEAQVKIYLDASARERARRRFEELMAQGKQVTMEETFGEMDERDRRDQEREFAPLRRAEDAILIDSSTLSADAVVERVKHEIENKLSVNQIGSE